MNWDDIDWDRVTCIEMLCKCGHVCVFTVMNNNCEMCGLKLEYQFANCTKSDEVKN